LGVFLVFFWSPVTGSKEQRSAKCQAPPRTWSPPPRAAHPSRRLPRRRLASSLRSKPLLPRLRSRAALV
jgi:hypothetical protein